jgi:hypothetical protein
MSTEHTDGNESIERRTEQTHLAGESGIIVAGDDGEILDESDDDGDDCACDELPEGVPCWPCYRDGATFDH